MHRTLAKKCAELSLLSYRYANISDRATDIQAIAQQTDKYLIFAFRGSSSLRDWWTNIRFNHLVYPWEHDYQGDVRMHQGISEAYKSIRDRVFTWADACNLPIITTGHSQGGMLALVAAVDLQYNFGQGSLRASNAQRCDQPAVSRQVASAPVGQVLPGRKTACISFGSPAVGNEAFRESCRDRISCLNYVNRGDIIPFLLPHNKHQDITWTGKFYFNPHHIKNYIKSETVR